MKLQEKEFFAEPSPSIAGARNAATRKRLIAQLERDDPSLWQAFRAALRHADGVSHVLRDSGRYPLTGRGDINTYSVFAELMRSIIKESGQAGAILPTGIATDDTTKHFFGDIVSRESLVSIHSFENEEKVFPTVHNEFKFCLFTMAGTGRPVAAADFVFFARQTSWLADPERHFNLTAEDFELLNPNTRTCPTFRSRRDAEIAKATYRRMPVLVRDGDPDGNPWDASFLRMFDMANDSALFYDSAEKGRLPLYEAKMLHIFDHRYGTYEGQTQAQSNKGVLPQVSDVEKADPSFANMPHYWVDRAEVEARLAGHSNRPWLLGWRKITNSVTSRTLIAAVMPIAGFGDSGYLAFPQTGPAALLVANLDSFVLDWTTRQKIGGTNLNLFIVEQLPVLAPATYDARPSWSGQSLGEWLRPYVTELVFTAGDLAGFAADLGWTGSPFLWDAARRAVLRAEVDASFFHLYGIERQDVDHIMDSFWVVRERDEKEYGSYQTKELILEAYDAIAVATSERPFVSRLVPGPGDPAVAHPPRAGKAPGRWIPWADVERAPGRGSGATRERRPVRRENRPALAPPILFPARPVEPETLYPQAASAHRRAAESAAPTPTASPSQATLADLSRAAAASADWLPEEAVDGASVVPGRRVRHQRFGDGVVIEVRRTSKPLIVTIRFGASGDHEILMGYGLIEFEAE